MMAGEADLWATLPLPVFVLDRDACIERLNPAAQTLLMLSQRTLAGQGFEKVVKVSPPLPEGVFRRVFDAQSQTTVSDVAVTLPEGSRMPLPATLHISAVPGEGGVERILLVLCLRESEARGGHGAPVAGASVRSAIGMAEMLAHEIKNPLAGITGAAQLLAMELPSGQQELTSLIVEESRRIVTLLERVEQFGNLTPPERGAVNLHDVLHRARQSALLGFGGHMEIVEQYDPSLPSAWADGDQLQQVFLNLLRNACEAASPEGGRITLRSSYAPGVRLRRSAGGGSDDPHLPLQIDVCDNGPGIPADLLGGLGGDVFDPFVSGRVNGTGLGLALVARIISAHGALITLTSRPGHTCFRLSLPMAQGAVGRG